MLLPSLHTNLVDFHLSKLHSYLGWFFELYSNFYKKSFWILENSPLKNTWDAYKFSRICRLNMSSLCYSPPPPPSQSIILSLVIPINPAGGKRRKCSVAIGGSLSGLLKWFHIVDIMFNLLFYFNSNLIGFSQVPWFGWIRIHFINAFRR